VNEQLPLLHVCEQFAPPHEQDPPEQSFDEVVLTTQLSAVATAATPRSETKILIL
jgi:hypothetical protein